MLETPITRRFRLRTPILNAGMAMIARPALAAEVCRAGGLGTIGNDVNPPEGLRALVHETRELTGRPFGVDLIGDFTTEAHIDVLVEERVALVIFFWAAPPAAWVRRLQAAGSAVWMQVGSVAEAQEAVALGVDALIVQGAEAGGHNRAEADVGDTVITTRFGPEWPDQPMRVIVRPPLQAALAGEAPAHDGSVLAMIGMVGIGGARVPLPPFSAILPMRDFEGDIDRACLTAGQGAGNIDAVLPAAEIVRRMDAEARQALLLALHAAGWLLVVVATFQIDHWSLFGLRQAWRPHTMPTQTRLATPWLYRHVRHPLMSGFLLLLWSLPGFTQGHAVLAASLTLYILLGTRLEEADLRRTFGDAYRRYAEHVPGLLPRLRRVRRGAGAVAEVATPALTVAATFGGVPQRAAAPLVLILPAMGVAAGFYERFGASLATAVDGTVWLVELPGQGRSPLRARRGDDFGYADVVDHGLPALVAAAARQHPGRPLFLVGHSLGGQLALLSLEQLGAQVAGLVLIASGSAHWAAWPRTLRRRARGLVLGVTLMARLLPWYPGARLGFGGDQSRRWMRDWSHNARHGGYRLHAGHGTAARVPDLRGVSTPVLALTIHGDPVAPWEAGQALLSLAPNAPACRQPMRGVLADAPWKRHFSWARQPDEAVRHSAAWIRERTRSADAANDAHADPRRTA